MDDLNKKIGSMFIVAVPLISSRVELFAKIKEYIDFGVGGFMIGVGGKIPYLSNSKGIIDIEKTKDFISKLKKLDPSLFLAIDGEGGNLFNLLTGSAQLKSAREYGRIYEESGSTLEFESDLTEYITLSMELGINMNFAPVLDTALEKYRGYISEQGRSYSDKEKTVKKLGNIAICCMQGAGIIPVGKHFPGYGPLRQNPHISLRQIDEGGLVDSPYASAIKNGMDAIMKGHVLCTLDKTKPASLSPKVEEYLRSKLKFSGLSIVDELFMGAISEHYYHKDPLGKKRVIDAALCNDILLISYPKQTSDGKVVLNPSDHDHFQRLSNVIYNAVNSGKIPISKINESYRRILEYKRILGIIPKL